MKLSLEQSQNLAFNQNYWDAKLTRSSDHPFPLAPNNLVEKGLINEEIYQKENEAWGNFVTKIMISESLSGPICILGAGLCRDWGWVRTKATQKDLVFIVEGSNVAYKHAHAFIKKYSLQRKVKVILSEVLDAWQNGDIHDDCINAYFLSQFLEHQGDSLPSFTNHLGNFLRDPKHAVYLVTPRLEDNPPEKVFWEHAVPLSDEEWQAGFNNGLGRPVAVKLLGKHAYINRIYSFFKVERPK